MVNVAVLLNWPADLPRSKSGTRSYWWSYFLSRAYSRERFRSWSWSGPRIGSRSYSWSGARSGSSMHRSGSSMW